jgi:hypothetical protein
MVNVQPQPRIIAERAYPAPSSLVDHAGFFAKL